MRMMFLIPALGPGGAERALTRLAAALSGRHEIVIMTYESPGTIPFFPLPDTVMLLQQDLLGGRGLERLRRLSARLFSIRGLVAEIQPDVVLSFLDTMNITAVLACLGTGVPVVVSERTDPSNHKLPWPKSQIRLLAYLLAKKIVVQTERVRRYFPNFLHPSIAIIPNSAPIALHPAQPGRPNAQQRFRVVAMGRLSQEKGFDRLISAFGRLAANNNDWDLVIFGEGVERLALETQVARLSLEGRVFLPGVTHDVETELSRSNLFVIPSHYEGFPNILAESNAIGLPAIGFRHVSGIEDLILHEETGLLVTTEDPVADLAHAMLILMKDDDKRSKYGTAARQHALRWLPDIIHSEWERVLTDSANNKNWFSFGDNWQNFLRVVDDRHIFEAQRILSDHLGHDLSGKTFLDAGSGSGLMSLAARRLGARVMSFDRDPQSVACTRMLKEKFFPDDPDWTVQSGDVLDTDYLAGLGTFDIVYSWGVLHHTGAMWEAMEHIDTLVAAGGSLFIAIYNDQGRWSRWWLAAKRFYNRAPAPIKAVMAVATMVRFWALTATSDLLRKGDPSLTWRQYHRNRGMSPWHDVIDWIGGYPFEVAKPEEVFEFFRRRNYTLEGLITNSGIGCNQFIFSRNS